MKCAAVFIAAISLALGAQTPQPKTGLVTGEVTDVMGAAIGKADIYIRTYAPPSAKG